ncbi:hypothetical protein ACQPWY_26330 [Pseudonocardia xinjiangensis]|uniref:hypothetical protein n=1 Tax=Pseudonocardia xinjiangensis TaxID=75289 RepID=UPI003D906BDD
MVPVLNGSRAVFGLPPLDGLAELLPEPWISWLPESWYPDDIRATVRSYRRPTRPPRCSTRRSSPSRWTGRSCWPPWAAAPGSRWRPRRRRCPASSRPSAPLFAEQPANAERLAEAGVAVALDPTGVDASTVAAACREVLEDTSFHLVARGFQRRILGLPGVDRLVADLTALVA